MTLGTDLPLFISQGAARSGAEPYQSLGIIAEQGMARTKRVKAERSECDPWKPLLRSWPDTIGGDPNVGAGSAPAEGHHWILRAIPWVSVMGRGRGTRISTGAESLVHRSVGAIIAESPGSPDPMRRIEGKGSGDGGVVEP